MVLFLSKEYLDRNITFSRFFGRNRGAVWFAEHLPSRGLRISPQNAEKSLAPNSNVELLCRCNWTNLSQIYIFAAKKYPTKSPIGSKSWNISLASIGSHIQKKPMSAHESVNLEWVEYQVAESFISVIANSRLQLCALNLCVVDIILWCKFTFLWLMLS
jgi:hypothetical protein